MPSFVAATAWYLIVCSILMVGQYYLERRFGRGFGVSGPARPRRFARPGGSGGAWSEQALVHAVNVHKAFHGTDVLKGIDLDVHKGQVFCLLGPSGSGKTTFLRCVNQLETIDGAASGSTASCSVSTTAAARCTGSATRRSPSSARRSAWSSSASTSSRT